MRVYASHDGGSGCAWYRMLVPLRAVDKLCDDVTVHFRAGGPKMMKERHPPLLLTESQEADVIVAQRANSIEGMGVWRRFSTPTCRTVYENDDDIWNITYENKAAYENYKEGGEAREVMVRLISTSNLTTVSTPHLGDAIRELTGNSVPVAVLPNYVPEYVLDLKHDDRKGRPRLGWMGGASHARDILQATGPVRRFMKRFPDWDLVINGTDYRSDFKCPPERSYHVPWIHVCDDPDVFYRMIDFDIGICPLLDTRFARSKCFDAETRVLTARGVLKGSDLQVGDELWREGSWIPLQALEHANSRNGYLITTADGYQLRLTPEHRMEVNGRWVQAQDLVEGDCLRLQPETAPDLPYVEVPWPADGRKTRNGYDPSAFLTAEDSPVLRLTPRWGRLLGAFAGDGSVGQSTSIVFSCDGQDQDWIDLLTEDLRAIGLSPGTEAVTTREGQLLRRRSVRVASQHLLRTLHSLGVTEERDWKKARYKRVPCVPEVVWRSPRAVIAEFLAGYFESDGHVKSAGIAVTSKTESLIRDVQRLLLLFGITSRVVRRTGKAQNGFTGVYWHCELRKREALLFQEHIGFRSARKRERLAAELAKIPGNAPVRSLAWQQEIVKIEPCDVTPVDVQVEGSVFALSGFVSHNSHIKALEYMARGIPVVASDVEPYRHFIDHGVNGFIVKREHEWLKYLSELAGDADLRAKMSAAAKAKAREHTIEGHYMEWVSAYKTLFPVGWEFQG